MRISISSQTRSWDTFSAGEVAKWAGSGESIVVMKTRGNGFVNLKTGEIVKDGNVANSPWIPVNAELKVEAL